MHTRTDCESRLCQQKRIKHFQGIRILMEVALYIYTCIYIETFMDAVVCQLSTVIREYLTRAK